MVVSWHFLQNARRYGEEVGIHGGIHAQRTYQIQHNEIILKYALSTKNEVSEERKYEPNIKLGDNTEA